MQNTVSENKVKDRVINLDKFRTPNSIVLSGRDKGVAVREKLNLDAEDRSGIPVVIEVPGEVVSLNSSFFLGLFADSIRFLKDKFDQKYSFVCTSLIQKDIDRGKREALNEANPLAEK